MTEPELSATPEPELSATQIKTADECARKWAFKYLSGLEDPGSTSTELGKDCHTGWEWWLKEGVAPEVSGPEIASVRAKGEDPISIELIKGGEYEYARRVASIVTSGIAKLPAPKSHNLKVEGEFHFTDHGVAYRGFKDLTWWTDDSRLILHDHKTTSALKWAKTQEQLRTDVQLNLYAQSEFQTWDVNEIEANWHYTTTDKTPTTRPVHLTVYRDAVDEQCASIAERAKTLLKYYDTRPDPNDLPPPKDLAICDQYRGCPYKKSKQCKISAVDRVRAAFRYQQLKGNPMNFFDRKKQADAAKAGTPAPTQAPAPAPVAPQQVAQTTTPGTQTLLRVKLQAPPPSPGAQGVVPPEAASAPAPAAQETAVQGEPVSFAGPAPAAKKSPGRSKKDKDAIAAGQAMGLKNETPERIQAASGVVYEIASGGFTLYVNCAPEGVPVTRLDELLAPLAKQVEETMGVADYRLVDYGKGKDALVYALKASLEQEPITGNVVVDLRTSEGAMCALTLRAFAAAYVRGF